MLNFLRQWAQRSSDKIAWRDRIAFLWRLIAADLEWSKKMHLIDEIEKLERRL